MRDFFLFNFLGIALMMLGIYFVAFVGSSAGPFLMFIGLFSVLLGYKYGFEAQRP